MAKYYITSNKVSFVVCANDAEGAALWAMHRIIDEKICDHEEQKLLDKWFEDDFDDEPIDGIPEAIPYEAMLNGLAEFGEMIKISQIGSGRDEAGLLFTDEIFRQWRQLMCAVDRLFDQMG
jgi:hypothetical protein